MDCYVTVFQYKSDQENIVYVGIDMEKAKEEAHERSDWASKIWIEVWKDGKYDRSIDYKPCSV
ncbi:hypothetical protein D3C73_1662920 [compost metagenome]